LSDPFNIDFRVSIDSDSLQGKYEARAREAQAFLDSEVIRQSRPYVPFVQGTLANTVVVEEPGKIVYVQPYARRQYYGDSFDFTPTFHPDAGARWTDRAKASFLPEWKRGVESILKGGNR
jgi:hypothetical protein